jgi:starch synthase
MESSGQGSGPGARRPLVALLPWGFAIEDFLDPNGLTLDTFCRSFRGSWMFSYADALRTAEVETVFVCFSRAVKTVARRTHEPTGAGVLLLPLPRAFRTLAKDPYGRTVRQMFGRRAAPATPFLAPLKVILPYLSTSVRLLGRELHREGVASVLCQEYEFPRFDICVLSKPVHRLPVFGVYQGSDYRRWRLERLVRPRAVRRCDGLVVGPGAEVERVMRLYGSATPKIARILNPVDVEVFRPGDRQAARRHLGLPASARIAVWHGRVELPKKGLDVLMESWAELTRRQNSADRLLLLVGDGEDASRLATEIRRRDLGNVVFVNRMIHDPHELRTYLGAADVYVIASRHEGLAVAPIEAMACGLPVVASGAGGMPDIVGSGAAEAGILVRPEDPVALAGALRELLDDEVRSSSLGAVARRRAVEEFSLEVVGAALREFLLV